MPACLQRPRRSAALKAAAGARNAPSTRERAQGLERENGGVASRHTGKPTPNLTSVFVSACGVPFVAANGLTIDVANPFDETGRRNAENLCLGIA